MDKKINQIINERDNDYSHLELHYKTITNSELVRDPYNSINYFPQRMELKASIIIPTWNACDTITKCLKSIEQSSFNRKYSNLLDVIVVDDGSTDSTWQILKRNLGLKLNLTIVRHRKHYSRSFVMNTGLSLAKGDIIISCDADMILSFFTIEEFMKRHQLLDKILLIGFRSDINNDYPKIQDSNIAESIPTLIPNFFYDNRVQFHWSGQPPYPGWPENMCRESNNLKDLGFGRQLWMPDGEIWDLPRMVYGCLFSLPRKDYLLMNGFDENFLGWGWEDSLVGAKAIALGNYVIPIFSAVGYHIFHPIRTSTQWEESDRNFKIYQNFRDKTIKPRKDFFNQVNERIVETIRSKNGFNSKKKIPKIAYNVFNERLTDPEFIGDYYFHLGRFDEACAKYDEIIEKEDLARFYKKRGKIFLLQFKTVLAENIFKEGLKKFPDDIDLWILLAIAQVGNENYSRAKSSFKKAQSLDPNNHLVNYIINPKNKHFERGIKYTKQGYYQLALRDFIAAIIQEPDNKLIKIRYNDIRKKIM
ncbi:MAG: glycosyltransferase [Promethearchaeota archaeon]